MKSKVRGEIIEQSVPLSKISPLGESFSNKNGTFDQWGDHMHRV